MTDNVTTYQTKQEILTESVAMREHSVMLYQINIDNYTYAIADIDATENPSQDLVTYRQQLNELLASEKREQSKEQVILRALQAHLAALTG
jgi:hypothetical protein